MNKYHKKNIFTLKKDGWVWTGECLYDDDSGDFVPFGKGKMEISDLKDENRGAYRGEVIYGELHGSGTYTYADGDKYVGEWKNGELHGSGTWHFEETEDCAPYTRKVEYKNGEEIDGEEESQYGI